MNERTEGWEERFDEIIFGGVQKDWTVQVSYSEKERKIKDFIRDLKNQATRETVDKAVEIAERNIKPYWHIKFEGVKDQEELKERIAFNTEVTLLINSVLEDVLASLISLEK